MVTICKLVLWLLTFGVAYFIQSTELISLATAFFSLHAAIVGLLLLSLLLTCAFGREAALKTYGSFLIRVLRFFVAILITSVFSFIATLLLSVDFYTAYMLTSLGQCMYNIDVVDESDFVRLKSKFKNKKKCKKAKSATSTPAEKKQPVPQTIADKKVQQATIEKKPVVDTIPEEENVEIIDAEIEPIDEDIQEDEPEVTSDSAAEPLQTCEQNESEYQLKPVPDIPID